MSGFTTLVLTNKNSLHQRNEQGKVHNQCYELPWRMVEGDCFPLDPEVVGVAGGGVGEDQLPRLSGL